MNLEWRSSCRGQFGITTIGVRWTLVSFVFAVWIINEFLKLSYMTTLYCFSMCSIMRTHSCKWPALATTTFSVLTRILPWGVPGPPLLRNRGPVRTLGGQSYKKHAVRRTWARTPNCLLHEVPTWSNMAEEVFTIRRRSLRCSGTCVGPTKVKATKLKTLTHLVSCFLFIQTNRML